MANYNIDDILKSIFNNSDCNRWKPSEKIELVNKEIEKCKTDINQYISESDHDIVELVKESKSLHDEVQGFIKEMEDCKSHVEGDTIVELTSSLERVNVIAEELNSVNYALKVVKGIDECIDYLTNYENSKQEKCFLTSAKALCGILAFLDSPPEGFNELSMYGNLKESMSNQRDELLAVLDDKWNNLIFWDIKDDKRSHHIHIKFDGTFESQDIVAALMQMGKLEDKVSIFSNYLLYDILKGLIYHTSDVCIKHSNIQVKFRRDSTEKPAYDMVILNMSLIFRCLDKTLNINLLNDNCTIMSIVGKQIYKDFADVLVHDCLVDTIPKNFEELQRYNTVTNLVKIFQKELIDMYFFPTKDFTLLGYTEDMDVLFSTRACESFLESARFIMFKDLSASMSIGVETIPKPTKLELPNEEVIETINVLAKAVPQSLFYFPRCMISKSAQELLDLVYVIMEQAGQCSDIVCRKLYTVTRLIFELYDAIVPYRHENYLDTIPQYVALFHNNCMFLAHNLLLLGEKWTTMMADRELNYPISYLDLVQELRDLGHQYIAKHMQQQRKQILDNIRSSDLNSLNVKDVLSDNAEQAVRQCLRQLQLLKNVWVGVFPINVFTSLMATLVNMFIEELIHRVCTVEDISAQMANQLTEIYTIVVKKAPLHFKKPVDIEAHVKSWVKLKELIMVMSGSLKDIEKRWSEGKGPLAVHFRTEELRSLIKALFQNTHLRANLLVKIK